MIICITFSTLLLCLLTLPHLTLLTSHLSYISPSTYRDSFSGALNFMGHLAYQCDLILSDTNMMDSLRRDNFDLAIVDAFIPCSFLVAHFLGLPYVAFYPGSLSGPLSVGLPSPLSYIPVINSQLSDHMGFWGRVKNVAWGLASSVLEQLIHAQFSQVGERHFAAPPSLPHLYSQAELWTFNTDFSLEFPQPLMPYTVCVGGLLSKPAAPVSQVWSSHSFAFITQLM